jgi:Tfp pilus assembly protein PilO
MTRLLRTIDTLRFWLGTAGQLGLLLIWLLALFGLFVMLPAQHKLQAQREQLAWLQAQPKAQARPAPVLADAQQLQQFYAQFPSQDDLSELLRQLHQLAQECGMNLVMGDYKLSHQRDNTALQRYEIILPVQARYGALRDFIAQAALRFPTLGLSEISIKRDGIQDDEAEVKLTYVWLLRGEGA